MRSADAVPPDFSECYGSRFRAIAAQLAVYLGSVEEAQEVTQEAFTRAWARWDWIGRYDDPAAWVRRVAWNLATSGSDGRAPRCGTGGPSGPSRLPGPDRIGWP